MKALTVQQPWAHAIAHQDKVENRSWSTDYRGPLGIHAGQRLAPGFAFADYERITGEDVPSVLIAGAFIAVADLVEVHRATDVCVDDDCAPWGWFAWEDAPDKPMYHWVIDGLLRLREPIRCKGRLGLWTPPADVLDLLQAVTR